MDANNWRTQLLPDAREQIVKMIIGTLVKSFPSSKQWALSEVKNIAVQFENKIYNTATSQKDYIQRISGKMSSIDRAPQNTAANVLPSNSVDTKTISTDTASHSVRTEVLEQGQSSLAPLSNQSQAHQELLSQNLHSTGASSRGRNSVCLSSVVPHMTSLTKIPKPNVVGQDSQLQLSGILPGLVKKSAGQRVSFNNDANSWRQVQEQEDFLQPVTQQQFQSPQQFRSKQQLQHQIPSQKFKQESITESSIQTSHAQKQQQQQALLQPSQLLSSQQFVIQTSPIMDISTRSGLPQQSSVQLQTKSLLQQHPQLVVRQQQQTPQALVIHHQRTVMQQPDGLVGQHSKHSSLQNLQLLSGQHNNQSKQQQQHLVRLGNVCGLQQKKLFGGQSGDSGMLSNQLSLPMSQLPMSQQAKVPVREPTQLTASSSLPTKGQQSQSHPSEMQLKFENQLQQENVLQNPILSQKNIQQRHQTSSTLLESHVTEQFQSQQAQTEALSDPTSEIRHANLGDWQEEVYQKIKSLKDLYLSELIQIFKKVAARYQELVSRPQQPIGDQSQKLKDLISTLEFLIKFVQVPKTSISLGLKEKLDKVENFIIGIINSNWSRKPNSSSQKKELPMPDMHSLQQSMPPQSQTPQTKCDSQPMMLNSTVTSVQKNNVNNLHYDTPKNIINLQQPGTKSNSQQLHAVKPSQQDSVGSPHIHVSTSQQSMNGASLSQNNMNIPQQNTHPLRLNSSILQQKELPMADTKQIMKQLQQHEVQQQLMKKKEGSMQPVQLGICKMPQNTMNKENELKVKQFLDFAPGILQHRSGSQHSVYNQHQLKSRGSFGSLPQLLQPASDQISQSSSPQTDQENIIVSSNKTETSLKAVDSPSNVPSPLTPFSQSPMLGDIGGQQVTSPMGLAASLVISTPGISSSSLLEEPLQHLIELVKSMSDEALRASVNDIDSVVNLDDATAGSLSGNGAAAAIGEDLSATTKICLEAREFGGQDGTAGIMKMNRCVTAAPLFLSGGRRDRIKRFADSDTSDMMLSVTFRMKKPKLEAHYALLEEIREINQRLVDTVVDLSEEYITENAATAQTRGGEGTIVKCSFSAVVAYSNSKPHQASAKMPILPLHLLVPRNYPNCSPMLLDKLPEDVSEKQKVLSEKAKLKLSTSLKNIMEPISLEEIARTWDDCARAVICEYAQQSGGGSFSSTYGTWESCLSAA